MKKTTLLIVSVLFILSCSTDNSKEALLKKIKKAFPAAAVNMETTEKQFRVADEFETYPMLFLSSDMETSSKVEKLINEHLGFSTSTKFNNQVWTTPDYGVVKFINGNQDLVLLICSKMRAELYLH
ncbi:MAG: hypothetical protein WCS03_01175 [Bacteroidota bacterium]